MLASEPNGLSNRWRWLRRWHPQAEEAAEWACRQFPPEIQRRGVARAYYEYLWQLDEILKGHPGGVAGLEVLDVGCGAGVVPLALTHLGARVTAMDRFGEYADEHDNQMGRAGEIIARLERHGVSVYCGDFLAEGLPGEPETYGLITCFGVIEHLNQSPRELFEQMRALLKPGGRVVITTPNHAWIRNRLRLLAGRPAHDPLEAWWRPGFSGHHREYTLEELKNMLEWSGLRVRRAVSSNWAHASSRLRRASPEGPEQWTTRFTLDRPERWLVAGSLLATAPFASLRYTLLALAEKPERPE